VRDFGSTAWQVAIHAICPVVVVREIADPTRRRSIVVGVDGSAHSALALDYAFQRAASEGVDLVAVHGWQLERLDELSAAMGGRAQREMFDQSGVAELTAWLRPVVARYPNVPVRSVSAREEAGTAILRESQAAQLVVVGSRGRGGFRGTLLGSVGMELLRKATCPVAIVRG
jgi:nucleotide-binding universal stress UspA family protein